MTSALRSFAALPVLFVAAAASVGCQSQIAGQTLPSAHYLRDDVQFFPAGDEFLLSNSVRAIEEYKVRQADGTTP